MFTQEQESIYTGLKEIAPSIANFYLDAVRLIDPSCTLQSKANLIAHLAREIDGGLRAIFAPRNKEERKGHFSSILEAVGTDDPNNIIAKEWASIADKNFARIAHRDETLFNESKDVAEMLGLWSRYERILAIFIGSYYSLLNRLDGFLAMVEPPQKSFPALINLLKNPQHSSYFFVNLKEPLWLVPLRQHGFYELENAPKKRDGNDYPDQWLPIKYLVNISPGTNQETLKEIRSILGVIVKGYLHDDISLNPYTIADIAQVVVNLNSSFSESERLFFEKFARCNDGNAFGSAFQTYLLESLPAILFREGDKEGMIQLLLFVLGFSTIEEDGLQIDDIGLEPNIRRLPNVDGFYVHQFIEEQGKGIIQLLGESAFRIVFLQLQRACAIDSYQFSPSLIPSIEPTDQMHMSNDWDYYLVCFIRDFARYLEPADLERVVIEMLNSKVDILQRISIHLIRTQYSTLAKVWWDFVSSYQEGIYIHEPYVLLHETSINYTDEQFEQVLNWIELNNNRSSGDEHNFAAYNIRRWLSALNPNSEKSKELLEKKMAYYTKLNSWKLEHPSFDNYSTMTFGYDQPIASDDFSLLTIEKQVKYLEDFKEPNDYENLEMGLSDLLKNCVKNDPEKYLYSLSSFLSIHTVYLHSLMTGFTEAIREGKFYDYSLVIDFIDSEIHSEIFAHEISRKFGTKRWFVHSITEFLSAIITNSDAFHVTPEILEKFSGILLFLLNDDEFKDDSDTININYETHILNSTQGKLHRVLLDVSTLWGKLATRPEDKIHWQGEVKNYFTVRLYRTTNGDKDFSIILGQRIQQLLFFDKDWVLSHIYEIFPSDNPQHLKYTMFSALSIYYKPTKNLYDFFRENNLFSLALDNINFKNQALERIVYYGLLEWKFWHVDFDKGLLKEIINRGNSEQIVALIQVILKEKMTTPEEVKHIWKEIFALLNKEAALMELYPMTLWLYELCPVLDEDVYHFIDTALNNIENGSNAVYFLLKFLLNKADSNSNLRLSAILINKLFASNMIVPHFEFEMKDFVKKLYDNNMNEIANEICVNVSNSGSLILKEIYNDYNGKIFVKPE